MDNIAEIEALESAVERNATLSRLIAENQRFASAPARISQIYGKLNTDQKSIFRSLVERYAIHTSFEQHAFSVAQRIAILINLGASVCIVTPYIANPSKPKSGVSLAYEVKSILNGEGFDDKRFAIFSTTPPHIKLDTLYLMIDDFSGSGKTVCLGVMDMLMKGAKSEQIHVDLFYAMGKAEASIKRCGVGFSCTEIGSRALSDFNYEAFGFYGDAASVYMSIEAMISIGDRYSLGFEASESLITLKRTPNNTLPVFWASKEKGGKAWPAPFPR